MIHSSADGGASAWSIRRLLVTVCCPPSRCVTALSVLTVAGLLLAGYSLTAAPVTLVVDGRAWRWHTRQTSVAGVLQDAGIALQPEDSVRPALDATLGPGDTVEVDMAPTVSIEADGRSVQRLTKRQRLDDIVAEIGISLKAQDELLVNGVVRSRETLVGELVPKTESALNSWPGDLSRAPLLRVVVRRSVPVTLLDGNLTTTFYTTRATVGEALSAQGMVIHQGDVVSPGLDTRIAPGLNVYVQRSVPVVVCADGRTMVTRTLRRRVDGVLAQEGVALMGRDYTVPPVDAAVEDGMTVEVVRVEEVIKVEQETTSYETEWNPDPDMPIDSQRIIQPGSDGVTKRRYRTILENDQPVSTMLEDEWLDSVASNRVMAYGTRVAVQSASTPDGPIEYWRRIRVFATAYNPASAGKSKDNPRYGMARIGVPAGRGIIAVDPEVIPLGSRVYVPGYGRAIAGDTGGAVLGRHVDLGFSDDEPLPHWARWVDIYLLTPVPSRENIRYVLPNWPQER